MKQAILEALAELEEAKSSILTYNGSIVPDYDVEDVDKAIAAIRKIVAEGAEDEDQG